MPFLKNRMYEGGSFETVHYDSDTARHHCVHLIPLFLNHMSPRTSCIHIYFGIWVADAALSWPAFRDSWLSMNVRSDVLLNWMYCWSLHTVCGNQKSKQRFFLCLGNANTFQSLFTWMMCCLIKSIYIWGMNFFFFNLICISYCKTKWAASLIFGDAFLLKNKQKKLGASESIKKTALQMYSSKIIISQKFITREDKLWHN